MHLIAFASAKKYQAVHQELSNDQVGYGYIGASQPASSQLQEGQSISPATAIVKEYPPVINHGKLEIP